MDTLTDQSTTARTEPEPTMSVAIAFADRRGPEFRYAACSDEQQWTGTVEAESVETAILDVIRRVRDEAEVARLRFVVHLPARSTLWALRDEIALLIPGVCVDKPRLSDEALVRAADGSTRGNVTAMADWRRRRASAGVTTCLGREQN